MVHFSHIGPTAPVSYNTRYGLAMNNAEKTMYSYVSVHGNGLHMTLYGDVVKLTLIAVTE